MAKKNVIITSAVGAVALFIGIGVGGTSAAPEAEVVTKTVSKEVEVEVTPQACLDALADGEALIQLGGEGMVVMSGAFDPSVMFNEAALDSITTELNTLESDVALARLAWDDSVAACKGGNS